MTGGRSASKHHRVQGRAAHPPGGWGTGWQPQAPSQASLTAGGLPCPAPATLGVPILALQRETDDGNWASQVVAILSPALWL